MVNLLEIRYDDFPWSERLRHGCLPQLNQCAYKWNVVWIQITPRTTLWHSHMYIWRTKYTMCPNFHSLDNFFEALWRHMLNGVLEDHDALNMMTLDLTMWFIFYATKIICYMPPISWDIETMQISTTFGTKRKRLGPCWHPTKWWTIEYKRSLFIGALIGAGPLANGEYQQGLQPMTRTG